MGATLLIIKLIIIIFIAFRKELYYNYIWEYIIKGEYKKWKQ